MSMKTLILILLMIAAISNMQAQDRTVTGRVTDSQKGNPLSGVVVSAKNGDIRTLTNNEGKYKITIPDTCKILIYNFPNMRVREIAILDKKEIDVTMTDLTSEVYMLTLEELLNVKITTAGKTEQKVSDIPASVIVVTKEEIQRYGYKDVSDIMKHIIGLYPTDIGFGDNFGVRGYWTSTLNRGIVVLVNGMDIRSTFYDQTFLSYLRIPAENIERLEFVRGPMGVMYGNGAFFGTLNIITKNIGQSGNYNSVSVTGGLENTGAVNVHSGGQSGDFTYSFNGSFQRTDGRNFDYSKMTDSIPRLDGTFTNTANTNNVFAQNSMYLDFSGQFKDFYSDIVFSNSKTGLLSSFLPVENEKPKGVFDLFKFNFGYRKAFSPKITLDAHVLVNTDTYSNTDYRYAIVVPGMTLITNPYAMQQNTRSWLGEINAFITPLDALNITLGYNYQHVAYMSMYLDLPELMMNKQTDKLDEPMITQSVYGKVGYWATENFLLEGGVRLIQRLEYNAAKQWIDATGVFNSDIKTYGSNDWQISPNIAVLYKINSFHNLKALFGKVICQPSFSENIYTTSKLEPQEIQSVELIYNGLYFSQLALSINVFNNRLKNLIIMVPADVAGMLTLKNAGKMEATGSELMLTYKPDTKLELSAAITYQQTKDETFTETDIAGMSPNWLANFKASYRLNKNFTIAATAHYVDEMEAVWDANFNNRSGNSVDAYVNLGANFRMEDIPVKNLYLNIRCTNLLGTDIYYANSMTTWYKNGMLGQGRYLEASLGYKF